MELIRFRGRIIPFAKKISCAGLPTVTLKSADGQVELVYNLSIQDSQVSVECRASQFNQDILPEVYKYAFDLARAATHLAAFEYGVGLTVVFEYMTQPNRPEGPIWFPEPTLEGLCTAFNGLKGFDEVYKILCSDLRLVPILSDLIHGISVPHEAVTSYARAIEGVKYAIAGQHAERKTAWQQMREALQVDESYLSLITDLSKDRRHGKQVFIPGTDVQEAGIRAWNIMNRFFEYLKRSRTPLPRAEFPVLNG